MLVSFWGALLGYLERFAGDTSNLPNKLAVKVGD